MPVGLPGRLERAAQMSEGARRIVEEHHPETREQDVDSALGQLGAAGVGHSEQGRRIPWRKRARPTDQRFGISTPSTWPRRPTRAASAKLDAPAPQPRSSTRSLVAGAAAGSEHSKALIPQGFGGSETDAEDVPVTRATPGLIVSMGITSFLL